jgi:peptidoglycan hydrolase-like protein with peptidoglycan-binding domain
MEKLTKKIFVGLMALALAFSFSFAIAEEDDIRAEMDALEQLLADLAAQLGGEVADDDEEETTTTVQITGIPAGYSFDRDLRIGSSGDVVRYLQIFLNADPDTRLTGTGAGSPGMETEYFGALTDAAVRKFQSKYAADVLTPIGLTAPTGYVGTQTRAKINALLATGEVAPAPTPDDEVLTMLKELSDAIKALSARVDALDTGVGTEGTLSVERRSTPRNVELYEEDTADVASFRLEAEDSQVTVQRMDLYFDEFSTGNTTATDFRQWVDNVAIKVGGDVVAERAISRSTLDGDAEYIRFSGLDIVVPKDGHKDFTVEVTASDFDHGSTPKTVYIGFANGEDAIRGVDSAGVTLYADHTGDVVRSFTLEGETEGELEVRRHADSPVKGVAAIDVDRDTEVELLRFNLKAAETDVELEGLTVEIEGAVVTNGYTYFADNVNSTVLVRDFIENRVVEVILYDGNDVLDSRTLSGGTATSEGTHVLYIGDVDFEFDLDVSKGTTKDLRVVVDVRMDDLKMQGFILGANLKATSNTGIGYDIYDNTVDIDRTISGRDQHIYAAFPMFSNVSTSLTRQEVGAASDAASGYIKFDVTAYGEDIEFNRGDEVTTETLTANLAVLNLGTWNEYISNLEFDTNALEDTETRGAGFENTLYYVEEGSDRSREFEINFTTTTDATGSQRAQVTHFMWQIEDDGVWYGITWTGDFLEDLKTSTVTLFSS